jgi:hypothetical protein
VKLADLLLEIESVADMDLERAAAVGRAYDADPDLRPRRVGGDPARIRVETTLEDLIRSTGLPIRWLTVRVNTRQEFEGGDLKLWRGRGGYIGWPRDDGTKDFALVPHEVNHDVLRSWADAGPDRLDRLAALFTRLCQAIDACYGVTSLLPRRRSTPPVDVGIGHVGWLNCFGPAFLERWPALGSTGLDTVRLASGGVVIRLAETPWDLDDAARRPVIDALGPEAILATWGPSTPHGVHVPSFDEHMRHSPGTTEMPWIIGEAERDRAQAARSRQRRYANARKRRTAAMDPPALSPPEHTAEWSTSFDTDDWLSFGRRLFPKLGGDLDGRLGRALLDEIATAPIGTEEAVAVATIHGTIEVRWFVDDTEGVDVYLFGPAALPPFVDAVFERWSDG